MELPLPQSPRVVSVRDYARMRWKNGAGWTSEIARWPDAGDWDWRLSIAEIDEDAPFSAFPGAERALVLLGGNGMRLQFDGGHCHELLPPHDCLRFPGEAGLRCELLDGPTRDFNLMWRRDSCDARLWHRPLVGIMALFVDPSDTWALHLMAGSARFMQDAALGALGAGDTALLPGQADRRRYVLDGHGEALLIRIARRHAAVPAYPSAPRPCAADVEQDQYSG